MAAAETQGVAADHDRHLVTFYEHEADLASAVVPYLAAGLDCGDVAVVIATDAHRRAFETALASAGVDVALAQASGRFITLEAESTLAAIVVDGQVDRDAFHEVVGGLMRRAAAPGRRLRAFGEMVALLWDAGAVLAAIELEAMWNELGWELEFSLFCAYSSVSTIGHEHAQALQQVCRMHSFVHQHPSGGERDARVHAPPTELTVSFPAARESPGRARRLIASELRHWGHDEHLVDDAVLVLSELASNAVIHAGSPFTVSIQTRDSLLQIAVSDERPVLAGANDGLGLLVRAPHGLAVIQALVAQWGVDDTPAGKTIWAELPIAAPAT